MLINPCPFSLSEPRTYGHIALVASIALGCIALVLFFSTDLGKLPTALLGGVGGGTFLILSLALYLCGCGKKSLKTDRGGKGGEVDPTTSICYSHLSWYPIYDVPPGDFQIPQAYQGEQDAPAKGFLQTNS